MRKQRLDAVLPAEFSIVLEVITSLADPVIVEDGTAQGSWDPVRRTWGLSSVLVANLVANSGI